MTTVASMSLHGVTVPLVRPFVTAQRSATTHHAVLVEVRDSEDRSGWGEAPCSWRVTGESLQVAAVQTGMTLSAGTADELAAAASFAASLVGVAVHDLDAGLWLSSSPVSGGAIYAGDRIRLEDAPGLAFDGLAS